MELETYICNHHNKIITGKSPQMMLKLEAESLMNSKIFT